MKVIATDLDRTLIPNGDAVYDGSMKVFKSIMKKQKFVLVYVTGRNLSETKAAIKKYSLLVPDFLISNVGTRIYYYDKEKKEFVLDKKWIREVKRKSEGFSVLKIKKLFRGVEGLRLQEKKHQDTFKVSYYLDLSYEKKAIREIKKRVLKLKGTKLVYSIDYPIIRGLVDILASLANKKDALNFVIKNIGSRSAEVYFSGDSGNDLSMLTSGYNGIVVGNASSKIKREVKEKKKRGEIYVARKQKELNGNYVSGILQGLIYYGVISKEDL